MSFLRAQKTGERADQVARDRTVVWQWIVVSVSGALLGLYVLAVSSLPPQWSFLVLLGTSITILAITIGELKRIFLAFVVLDTALQFDINLFYNYGIVEFGAYGGLSVSITTICLAALYTLWFLEIWTRKATLPSSYLFQVSLPALAYLGTTIFSLLIARNRFLALFEVALLIQMFLLYIYIVGSVNTREDILFVVVLLLSSLAIESLLMIALHFRGESVQILGILARVDGMRVGGTIGSANEAGGFLTMLLMCALGALLYRRGGVTFWMVALAFLLGIIALIFTYSRGGWLGFAFGVTAFCTLAWYRGTISPFTLIPIACVILLILFPFHDLIIDRLLGYDRGAAYSRIPLMKLAFRVIREDPLLGVGANNFVPAISQWYSTTPWLYVVHNKYLLIWAETGIVGLVAFLWFLFAALRRGWLCIRFSDPAISPLCFGLIAGILGIMVHMLVDLFHGRSVIQLIWLNAGLIGAMHCLLVSKQLSEIRNQKP